MAGNVGGPLGMPPGAEAGELATGTGFFVGDLVGFLVAAVVGFLVG